MSIYSNVTEQDLIILRKLADQQKEQKALKLKNRILKQTHHIKLAKSLRPINKKLEESTEKITKVINQPNSQIENIQEVVPGENDSEEENNQIYLRALPNSNKFSSLMTETLGALMNSKNSIKLIPDDSGRATILEVPINTSGGDRIQINGNIYDLTPEIYKALSDTGYTGKNMKSENDI